MKLSAHQELINEMWQDKERGEQPQVKGKVTTVGGKKAKPEAKPEVKPVPKPAKAEPKVENKQEPKEVK